MLRRNGWTLVALLFVCLLILGWPSAETLSQSVRQVFVTNFPSVQQVSGELALDGPVLLSRSTGFRDITVPPISRHETTRMVEAGVLTVEGFPRLVLSLHGVVKGDVGRTGAVGAILIPDEPTIEEAFREQGILHFYLETVSGEIVSGSPYFASPQQNAQVAFPSYRVLLYNTTDKTVSANLFVYLTN